MQHLYTGFDGNILSDPRTILLPEVGRSKATWLTKGVLSEKPVDKCFVKPLNVLS